MLNTNVDPFDYNAVMTKARTFFQQKGFIECYTQNRLSILAACEDPTTIATAQFGDMGLFPFPQTNQMWLENILLGLGYNVPGIYCTTTSYRYEKNPVPNRHDKIFPMLEFESNKNMEELILFEREFLESLGFGDKDSFPEVNYLDMCEKYQVKELGHEHEMQLYKDYGPVVFLKNFPEYTSPFWNMSRCDNLACKVDVIVCGVETIGSAERSCDPEEMKRLFNTISDGEYANLLYSLFTKERVDAELEEFLQHQFFIRSGAGVGITRLIKAMKQLNLI